MSASRAAVVLLAAVLGACSESCCVDPVSSTTLPACAAGETCEVGEAFRFGACVDAACDDDDHCCPGARCRADIGLCFPLLLDAEYACTRSEDCSDPAQRCLDVSIGERAPLPTCTYERCSGESDCGFGRTCFQGRCIETAPCGGTCPDGTACDVTSGKCTNVPAEAEGCSASCDGLRVIADPENMTGEACCAVTCACAARPPIVPTRFGRYSRIATTPTEVLVSAYDAQFGDLVLARFTRDGTFKRLETIDGAPAGAAVVAAPDGPRGGVLEPGPNVGTHTAIAVDTAGRARIAYHDEDEGTLRIAIEDERGFATHRIDGGDAEARVGQFTDIAVAPDGTIFVTYFAKNATLVGIPGRGTGMKLARSRTPKPTSPVDWDLFVVDASPEVDACGGCGAAEACVLNNGAAACLPAANGCDGCSGACVTQGGAPTCLPPPLPPEVPELPRGRGLHTSLALDGTTAIVASYDSVAGDVRVARLPASGAPQVFVVDGDGQAGRRDGDVGRFPAVFVRDGTLTVVYEDFTRHTVRAWRGSAAQPGTGGAYTVVDAGRGVPHGKRFVGAGARLARAHQAPLAVYQDATTLDLRLAAFAANAWTSTTLAREGAHGFYSDVAVSDGKAYVANVVAELDSHGVERSRLELIVVPVP